MGDGFKAKCAARVAGILTALSLALAAPAGAAEKVKMSTFQANLCCFTVYVAKALGLTANVAADHNSNRGAA